MVLDIQKFQRRPFEVEAVAVTPENIAEVAAWCGGEVRTSNLTKSGGREGFQQYIKLEVKNPLNDRQTRAYYDDWVLSTNTGFKIYTPKAFDLSFEKKVQHMTEVINRMEERAAAEAVAKAEQDDVGVVVTPNDFVSSHDSIKRVEGFVVNVDPTTREATAVTPAILAEWSERHRGLTS